MNNLRLVAALALLSLLAGAPSLYAQRDAKVPDPDPEIERKSFQVADGFEVNLFAADPLLAKPIQMNFDPKGRLWVATSEAYPQVKPGQKPNDKVIVLEDTKGEGRADKVTVFADGLLIPTGIEPGDGGCYVADSTDLLHLADTRGTGKADKRRVVLSGFGTEDTHHIVHTFRWGPDGMLYFNQSIYIHSHIETPHGARRLNAGGVWQFRPETMQLEVFLRGFCNPWGHSFDRWGQSFVTDGAYGEGINYGLPGAYYVFANPSPRLMTGLNPGSPKHCGLDIVSGRHLPDDWQGNMITNDFRGHRVCRFVVTEDGAGYASREKPELIKTNHPAFRPVDVKMGPDGAIYIADWYNPIIQHGEVDFRDPRRDVTHGRIWRVTRKDRPLVKRPQLDGAKVEDLLEALKAPEDWTRQQAKRVLKERGAAEALPALATWVAALDGKDAEHEHHLLEALWTYQSLDAVEPKLLDRVLHAKDGRARAAAVRVASQWHDRLDHPMELLAGAVRDEHPRVRLEAVRALGQIPSPRSVEIAMQALDKPVDRFLDYALWLTARELEPLWLPLAQKGEMDFGGDVRRLIFALQASDSRDAARPLVNLVRSGKVPAEREEGVLAVIAGLGNAADLGLVLDRALADKTPPARQAALLDVLVRTTHERGVRPAGDLARVASLLTRRDDAVLAVAARAAGAWQVESARPTLVALCKSAQVSDPVRQAAFDGLARLGGKESQAAIRQMTAREYPLPTRRQALMALCGIDLAAAAKEAPGVLAETPEKGADPTEVFTAFLERKNGAIELAKALAGQKLPAEVAKVGVRIVRTSAREAPALVEALTKAGGLTTGPRQLSEAEMKQMIEEVARSGDAARGEKVFRRADMVCLKCHAIAGAGGQVGPDLVSIGASAPVDYLIDSLLLPSKAIKENYGSLVVETKRGLLLTGVKVRETKTELVLRNAEDAEVTIPINQIDSRENSKKSLMPEGLTDTLTRGELIDLVRFLSELGKVGPYSVSKARLVRRWQVLEPTREAYTLLARTSHASAAGNDPALMWSPGYSTVGGELPAEAMPLFKMGTGAEKQVVQASFVRCQLDATTAGKAKLLLNSARGVRAWLDGEPVEAKEQMVLDLGAGAHTLTLALDRAVRSEPLRVELDDVAGSPARVRLVGGK
jgi:putative heme-binding domain-containing protein